MVQHRALFVAAYATSPVPTAPHSNCTFPIFQRYAAINRHDRMFLPNTHAQSGFQLLAEIETMIVEALSVKTRAPTLPGPTLTKPPAGAALVAVASPPTPGATERTAVVDEEEWVAVAAPTGSASGSSSGAEEWTMVLEVPFAPTPGTDTCGADGGAGGGNDTDGFALPESYGRLPSTASTTTAAAAAATVTTATAPHASTPSSGPTMRMDVLAPDAQSSGVGAVGVASRSVLLRLPAGYDRRLAHIVAKFHRLHSLSESEEDGSRTTTVTVPPGAVFATPRVLLHQYLAVGTAC